jgi:hypothetical protein
MQADSDHGQNHTDPALGSLSNEVMEHRDNRDHDLGPR